MTPLTDEVKAFYSTGKPGIAENEYGEGSAVFLGLDLSHQCLKPGNIQAEQMLVTYTLGEQLKSPYACEGALVYRLSAPDADHYFFINDGPAKTVVFRSDFSYKQTLDALTGEEVNLKSLRLEADDAFGTGDPQIMFFVFCNSYDRCLFFYCVSSGADKCMCFIVKYI